MQRFLYLFLTISLFNHLRKKLNTHLTFEYAEFWGLFNKLKKILPKIYGVFLDLTTLIS